MVMTSTAPAEQRVLLQNISWQLFESVLNAMGEDNHNRISYYQGKLEFMSPLWVHENSNRLIERLIVTFLEELNFEYDLAGSLTLKREDMAVGKEPDSSYYIQNEAQVQGKNKIDLTEDPPPDLVLEIDITSSSLNQLAIYADLGVPEVWRYDGNALQFYQLQNKQYLECDRSPTFPILSPNKVIEFLEECQTLGLVTAVRQLRTWIKE